MQDIIKRYDLPVDLGDGELVPEIGVDRIGEVNWGGSLGKREDVSFGCKDEYLIREDIDVHLTHEVHTTLCCIHDSLDGLHPITIF